MQKFCWQATPSRVTAFTDSDWAGCVKTARSTSGGAICLGEHVIKTYSRQQKVVALSSAEAELYATVAASAEALAAAAYARDVGMPLECELYCDSSAALGIAQRAGIGKVRHLRTQGLWVQEVRVSGRIVNKKILGTKNPADLMTKHMTADLARQHLETLNMTLADGRSEVAPTLNSVESFVRAWHEDYVETTNHGDDGDGDNDDGDHIHVKKVSQKAIRGEGRRVRFSDRVQFRPIPESGRCRRTPARGTTTRGRAQGARTPVIDSIDEGTDDDDVCRCGTNIGVQGNFGVKWSDYDDEPLCARCNRAMSHAMSTESARVEGIGHGGSFESPRVGARADEDTSESAETMVARAYHSSAALDRLLDGGSHCKYVRETPCQLTDSVASVGSRAAGETADPSRAQINVLGKSRRIRRWLPRHLRNSERRSEVADSSMRSRRRRSDGINPSQTHV